MHVISLSRDPRHQAADKTRSLDDPEAQELCWRKRGLHTDTGTNELGSMRCQYRPVTVCRIQRKRPQVQQLIGAAFGVAVADDDIETTPSAASSSAPEEAEVEKNKRYSSTVRQLCP